MAEQVVQKALQSSKIVVFSKTYCGYCSSVKQLFTKLGVPFSVIELNKRGDGGEIQNYLTKITGGTTVPRVFIEGKFIGGCDDTTDLHRNGELKPMLEKVGLKVNDVPADAACCLV